MSNSQTDPARPPLEPMDLTDEDIAAVEEIVAERHAPPAAEADALARLRQENEQLRETNRRLNRLWLQRIAEVLNAEAELARVTAERDAYRLGAQTPRAAIDAWMKDRQRAKAAERRLAEMTAERDALAKEHEAEQILVGRAREAGRHEL